jgi:hypothetical protein
MEAEGSSETLVSVYENIPSELSEAVMLLMYVRKVIGWYPGWDPTYPDRSFVFYLSLFRQMLR